MKELVNKFQQFLKLKRFLEKPLVFLSLVLICVTLGGVGYIVFSKFIFASGQANVWVDDDWASLASDAEVVLPDGSTGLIGTTAFSGIADGVGAVADGGTVNVISGQYYLTDQILISKSISIIGATANPASVVINTKSVETGGSSGFYVTADNVSISGLMITGNEASSAVYYGIDNNGGDNVEIKNCVIEKFKYGIYFYNSADGGLIKDNSLTTNSTGLLIESSSENIVTGNTTNLNQHGIYLAIGNYNTFSNNTISNNGFGVYLYNSSHNSFNNNIVNYHNNNSEAYGFGLESGSVSNTFSGNTIISNSYGFHVFGGANNSNELTNNSVTENSNGIAIQSADSDIATWVVAENSISGNTSFNILNYSGNSINIHHNWWGVTSRSLIQEKILGDAIFSPYYLDVERTMLSGDSKAITAFTITNQIGPSAIDQNASTIKLIVPMGTIVTSLTPAITITGASVNPLSGSALDFTNSQTYTVSALDETTKIYNVSTVVLLANQTALDNYGLATLNNNTTQVVLINTNQTANINIENETTNPTVNVSALTVGGVAFLPAMTISAINANNVVLTVQASTTAISGDVNWDGIITAPTPTTITLPETSGETKTLSQAIQIGAVSGSLSFDKAVSLLFPSDAGKRVGYLSNDNIFTEITTSCVGENGTTLGANESCKTNSGNDLVVWTRHLSKFATFSSVMNVRATGGGGTVTVVESPVELSPATSTIMVVVITSSPIINPTIEMAVEAPATSLVTLPKSSAPKKFTNPVVEVVKAISNKLFDILMSVQNTIINKSSDLFALIQFTSFGNISTEVRIDYRIEDVNKRVIYNDQDEVVVETEMLVSKKFDDLDVVDGHYTLIVTTIYNKNVIDEFRQGFEVRGTPILKYDWVIWLLAVIFIVAMVAYRVYRINRRKKIFKHKLLKK